MKSLLALLPMLVACGPSAPPPTAPQQQAEYPAVLHPPSELHPDFSVHQHIEASSRGHSGSFDAVLQKQGNELVVVGLGPASVRMFVLKQAGDVVTFDQSFGPKLPFPPRNILVDVHRAFFKGLPPGAADGERSGTVDDEEVREIWRGGNLVERRFTRKGHPDPITVTYGPGCTQARCQPARIVLDNPWFAYKLTLDNDSYELLTPEAKP